MFSVSRRPLARVSGFLLILALVLMPGLVGKNNSMNVTGSVTLADASTPRSYVEFIDGAYFGALGQFPSCEFEQAEYDALVNAAAVGSLRQESERFVSTLFETQLSFDDPGETYYCQSPAYEALNPAYCNPFINTQSDQFISALYSAFLLRQPDPVGFNGWMTSITTDGRKHVLNGFRFSTEFGILVNALYAGTRPTCPPPPPPGDDPCEGPNSPPRHSKLCP